MKINKMFCDNCREEVIDCECAENQKRFHLSECMDDGYNYDFCGVECLKIFLSTKDFEDRFYRFKSDSDSSSKTNGGAE